MTFERVNNRPTRFLVYVDEELQLPDDVLNRSQATRLARFLTSQGKDARIYAVYELIEPARSRTSQRSTLKRGATQLRRSPLASISTRRQRVNAERSRKMIEHFGEPSTWRCWVTLNPLLSEEMGPCYGDIHGHETTSRARAGQTDANLLDMNNVVLLCNVHNEWVESHPKAAHRLGLAKHGWESE